MKSKHIDRISPVDITSKISVSSLAPALSLLQVPLATSEGECHTYANNSSGVSKSGTHTHVYTCPFRRAHKQGEPKQGAPNLHIACAHRALKQVSFFVCLVSFSMVSSTISEHIPHLYILLRWNLSIVAHVVMTQVAVGYTGIPDARFLPILPRLFSCLVDRTLGKSTSNNFLSSALLLFCSAFCRTKASWSQRMILWRNPKDQQHEYTRKIRKASVLTLLWPLLICATWEGLLFHLQSLQVSCFLLLFSTFFAFTLPFWVDLTVRTTGLHGKCHKMSREWALQDGITHKRQPVGPNPSVGPSLPQGCWLGHGSDKLASTAVERSP